MSKTAKIVTWVVVIVVVVGGGIWWWMASNNNASTAMAPNMPGMAMNTTSTAAAPSSTMLASGNANSNAALQADLGQVDGQMNAMGGDNASITQGMNDQPVQQQQF
jgi:hypothetical protein